MGADMVERGVNPVNSTGMTFDRWRGHVMALARESGIPTTQTDTYDFEAGYHQNLTPYEAFVLFSAWAHGEVAL